MSVILLREVQERDVNYLEQLAQIPGFINLPSDREQLSQMIERSRRSFRGEIKEKSAQKYIFVAEDLSTGKVLGTSMIAPQHGSPESPHFYFDVGTEEKFSETINTGFIHGTLKLKYDTNGPSEIGGLVVDPETRNSPDRIGRQISFVRFLFVATHRNRFRNKMIAELLPPLNVEGLSPLWEAIGRRFTNMNYWEADRLCAQNKEFIFSLFPTGKIYTTFLTPEARHAIGKVGKATEPVMHMLKKIGFEYRNQVDPFDGGPHLWADVDEILPVRNAKKVRLLKHGDLKSDEIEGLVCLQAEEPGTFRACTVKVIHQDKKVLLVEPRYEQLAHALGFNEASESAEVVFTPYY